LRDLAAAEAELQRRELQRPRSLSAEEENKIQSLGSDLTKVWTAPISTDRDRKELLRALLEDVLITVDRPDRRAHLTLRWRGGTLTELDLSLPRSQPRSICTEEDTISLLRRLAVRYSDDVIAGILNRQRRKTATGERFTANQVVSLRRYRNIPRFRPPAEPTTGNWQRFVKRYHFLFGVPASGAPSLVGRVNVLRYVGRKTKLFRNTCVCLELQHSVVDNTSFNRENLRRR